MSGAGLGLGPVQGEAGLGSCILGNPPPHEQTDTTENIFLSCTKIEINIDLLDFYDDIL